jgi:hypothetical protein
VRSNLQLVQQSIEQQEVTLADLARQVQAKKDESRRRQEASEMLSDLENKALERYQAGSVARDTSAR